MQKRASNSLKFITLIFLVVNAWSLECLTIDEDKLIGIEQETVLSLADCSSEEVQNDLKEINSPQTDSQLIISDYQYSQVTIGEAHTLLNTDHSETNGSELYLAEDLIKILNYHTDVASEEVNKGTLVTEETISETEIEITTKSFIILLNKEKTKIINLRKLISKEIVVRPTTF